MGGGGEVMEEAGGAVVAVDWDSLKFMDGPVTLGVPGALRMDFGRSVD